MSPETVPGPRPQPPYVYALSAPLLSRTGLAIRRPPARATGCCSEPNAYPSERGSLAWAEALADPNAPTQPGPGGQALPAGGGFRYVSVDIELRSPQALTGPCSGPDTPDTSVASSPASPLARTEAVLPKFREKAWRRHPRGGGRLGVQCRSG